MESSTRLTPEQYMEESIKTQKAIDALARKLTGVQVPEFSSEPMTVKDVSNLTGIPEESVRKGIINGWLPIGVAVNGGKEVHKEIPGRVSYVIYPRKLWELTGHVWRGKGH